MYLMKSNYRLARNVFLICGLAGALFIGTVAQGGTRFRHYPPGRITVDRVPNFGWNLAFNLQIDGRPVANVAQGHSYSVWLPPGRHVLTVRKVPTLGYTAPISTTVNVQPGVNHHFTALWESDLVVLRPTGTWLTPGAVWQLPTKNSWASGAYYY